MANADNDLARNRCTCVALTVLIVASGVVLGGWYAASELLA